MRSEIGASHGTQAPGVFTVDPVIPAVLAALPGPVLRLDANGAVTGVNEAGDRLAGNLTPALAATLREHAARALATGETQTEKFAILEDGATRSIEASILGAGRRTAVLIGRDSTMDVNMRAALIESRRRYKDLVEISSDFAWETAADGAFSFVSPQGALGYPADALIGLAARDLLLDPDSAPRAFAFEAEQPVERKELWLKSAAAEPVCVLASALPLFDRAGRRKGARGVCRDITLERMRENDLARHKAREQVVAFVVDAIRNEAKPVDMLTTAVTSLGRAMAATSCAVYRIGGSGKFARAARYGALPDGRRLAPVLRRSDSGTAIAADRIAGHEILIVATQYRGHANGAMLLCRESGAAAWSDEDRLLLMAVAGQLGIALRQIGDQRELVQLSRTDPLTGLLNRRAFMDELARAMERSGRGGATSAVLYMDLNNFKAVNDRLGHAEGDRVLRQLSRILLNSTRPYDSVARLGGDEFAIWMEGIDEKTIRRRTRAILQNSQVLFRPSASTEKPLGLSVGVAVQKPNSPETPEQILKRADAAMYRVKKNNKRKIAIAHVKGREGSPD